MLLEVRLRQERGAVDPGEHGPAGVAAPVGPRHRGELEGLDPLRARAVRPAAEVGERAVPVERDRVHGLVADEVLDQLHLVVLALAAEALDRLGRRQLGALERLVGLHVLAHALLDALEVVLGDAHARGELEVVVEAVLDRRADRDLDAWVELRDSRGEHVRGVVADEPERPLTVLRGLGRDDLDAGAVGQRRGEVAQLGPDRSPSRGCRARPAPGPSRWRARRPRPWRRPEARARCRRGGGPSAALHGTDRGGLRAALPARAARARPRRSRGTARGRARGRPGPSPRPGPGPGRAARGGRRWSRRRP